MCIVVVPLFALSPSLLCSASVSPSLLAYLFFSSPSSHNASSLHAFARISSPHLLCASQVSCGPSRSASLDFIVSLCTPTMLLLLLLLLLLPLNRVFPKLVGDAGRF